MSQELVTRVTTGSQAARDESWWTRYQAALAGTGLTDTARQVIGLDAGYIVERGILAAGAPGAPGHSWPDTRLRRGLVLGAIQSGKTASMLGVTAMCLDQGVDIVVLLTGTRVALWRQTVERTLRQLDGWNEEIDAERRQARTILPPPRLIAARDASPALEDLYYEHPNRVRRQLQKRRPVIALVMKQVDHLIRFGSYLNETIEHCLSRLDRPLHLLLIDDEADDGSILDADVEAGLAPDSEMLKQIPRHIARIWAGAEPHTTTGSDRVFATYLAYTATPQANLLQSDHNPLSPTDFVVALRTPASSGGIAPPRDTAFEEPVGISSYYTGGELFYNRVPIGPASICPITATLDTEAYDSEEQYREACGGQRLGLLGEAIRAFCVAGAIRLLASGKRMSAARRHSSAARDVVLADSPAPHTMLVHPSASIEQQVRTAELIAAWTADPGLASGEPTEWPCDEAGNPTIDQAGLMARLEAEESLWSKWVQSYEATQIELSSEQGGGAYAAVGMEQWQQIRELLEQEIFPFLRLSIVNSDPRADDRPHFEPAPSGSGFTAANDLLTIFVSGNVMARGVTLEGLATTLFVRTADTPAADTQMQMQRWFGYRGGYLPWCRVFLFEDQLDLFRAYHETDEALRAEVITEMNRLGHEAPSPLVLQGSDFRATGKIANLRALPLCPGPQPFVRVIELGQHRCENLDVLADLLEKGDWPELKASGRSRGLIRGDSLSLIDTGELLESLKYSGHDPNPEGENHRRWRALESKLSLEPPVSPLFRPPQQVDERPEAVGPSSCPYSIGAYLRLWHAALTRRARGLYPTDDYRTPWSMINLASYAATAPRFNVGVRFGAAGLSSHGRLRSAKVQCMTRQVSEGIVHSTWGSRNPGEGPGSYLGDHLFDYHMTGLAPPETTPGEPQWRPRGHPGLVLFHVLRVGEVDAVTVGLALPLGGPDHFAALRPLAGGSTA